MHVQDFPRSSATEFDRDFGGSTFRSDERAPDRDGLQALKLQGLKPGKTALCVGAEAPTSDIFELRIRFSLQ
jgi:hypothetical protein